MDLNKEPIDYILTVHRTNFDITYGSMAFDLEVHRISMGQPAHRVVENICNHYGLSRVNMFLDEVVYAKTRSNIA
jgi:hypothetical protein